MNNMSQRALRRPSTADAYPTEVQTAQPPLELVNGCNRNHSQPLSCVTLPRNGRRTAPKVLFVTDFYVEEVLLGAVKFAREAGWDLIANMRFHGVLPTDTHADGILATITSERVKSWLNERPNWPVVRILNTPFELGFPGAEIDYFEAGRAGAKHLLDLGCLHYAYYWIQDTPDSRQIRDGFSAEMEAARRNVYWLAFGEAHPKRPVSTIYREQRVEWLAQVLAALPKPVAIMSDDDRRVLELLDACSVCSLRVPEDVAILGCDNNAVEQGMARLPFSSVNVDFKAVGYAGASILDRMMKGESICPDAVIKIPPRGIAARQSTATFATESAGISAAVKYLRQNFHKPLRIEQLARIAGVSPRVFETQFRLHVGHSARQELHSARLACAARLLRDTDLKLDAVAVESGFGSGKHLAAAFKQLHGKSPQAWRIEAQSGQVKS